MHRTPQQTISATSRRGAALLVVLVLVMLMSLAAWTFSDFMVSEYDASHMYARVVDARAFADSGVEMAGSMIDGRYFEPGDNLHHDPSLFSGTLVESDVARGTGRFAIVTSNERDDASVSLRMGLTNEASKYNLSTIFDSEDESETAEEDQRDLLLLFPNMTDELADALLDWIDEDDERRDYGAESDDYTVFFPPNGPMGSIDDLLKVVGVTPELVYGEDTNRNGLLDPNEDDGDASPPFDNMDGILDPGWQAYFTVYAQEKNLRADGTARININQDVLSELYDEVEAEFGEDMARFIVAWRMFGANDPEAMPDASTDEDLTEAAQNAIEGVANAVAGSPEGDVTRAGLDLTMPSQFQFRSVYDLIGIQVNAVLADQTQETIDSPWSDDAGSLATDLPTLIDSFSSTDDEFLTGRIDVNQARWEVLMTIPEMTEEIANSIVASTLVDEAGQPLTDLITQRFTAGWLVMEGIVDMNTMRRLAEFVTCRGDIYSGQSLGYFQEGGPDSRVEFIIDGSEYPSKVIQLRDISNLGRGFARSLLESAN